MKYDNNLEAFFALVRAGLWEQDVLLSSFAKIDYNEIMRLAEEQAVVGLVAAGLDHLTDVHPIKEDVLQFVGLTLQLEQQNLSMNRFIGTIVEKMRNVGIYTLLVKGQGIAQCYERPLWRSCGDIDFYLSETNYQLAKHFLQPLAAHVDDEDRKRLHLGMTIGPWIVELHGTLHSNFSRKMNKGLDDIHQSIFYGGNVRSWNNDGVTVFLPSADNDALIIFTHFIQHFYVGGIGIRQICDWCRLLWTYRTEINRELLRKRLKKMGLLSEWKAFAAFTVDYLAMPQNAMPFYDASKKWSKKASFLRDLIVEAGNLGYKNESYRFNQSEKISKMTIFGRRLREFSRLYLLFPKNAPRFFYTYMFNKTIKTGG